MKYIFALSCLVFISSFTFATETQVIVRVKAKDAKFIGSSLGGANVMIKDKATGEILAKGKTEGSTGNTNLIMNTPQKRYSRISDEHTSKFMASVDIDEPVFVTIEVSSPANYGHAQVEARTELWLIPGKHILGDGVIIEIPGFIVDVLEPRIHQYISLEDATKEPIRLLANIVMMCGCTINENGLWDSEKMEVKGMVKRNGEWMNEIPMNLVETNLFAGDLTINEAGQYEIIVYAYEEGTGNTGVDKVNFVIND